MDMGVATFEIIKRKRKEEEEKDRIIASDDKEKETDSSISYQQNKDDEPTSRTKQRTGLRKLRNTCYMNSIVQLLFHVPDFKQYFINGDWRGTIKQDGDLKVCTALASLLQEMDAGQSSVSPHDLKTVLHSSGCWSFARNEQQDAYEFLIALLDRLHQELTSHLSKRKKISGDQDENNQEGCEHDEEARKAWDTFISSNSSIMTDLFFGQQKATISCSNCSGKSNNYEPFLGLSLGIPMPEELAEDTCENVSLQDCLDLYLKTEKLTDWTCENCNVKVTAERKVELIKLPEYLVLKLKRTVVGEGRRGRLLKKVQDMVNFPIENLVLGVGETYNLLSVIEHMGQEFSGHYTASCKSENGEWTYFNDSRVHDMYDNEIIDSNAVILCYKRKKSYHYQ